MPFFSVVIPLFNKEGFIKKTIESVLNQSYSNFEIIVINDGSTDNSLAVIQNIAQKQIRIFSQENRGLAATRNTGFSLANGKVVVFLDADDYWLPNYLATIKHLHDTFDNATIYGTSYFEERDKQTLDINVNLDEKLKNKAFVLNDFFEANFKQFIPCQSSIGLKKENFSLPLFNPQLNYHEDVDFYLNYCSKHKVAISFKPLVNVYFGDSNRMSQSQISNKTLPDLEHYQKIYSTTPSILKYIDIQRYKYIIKYNQERQYRQAKILAKKINPNHLTKLQKIMIQLPQPVLNMVQRFKMFLLQFKIRLTTY